MVQAVYRRQFFAVVALFLQGNLRVGFGRMYFSRIFILEPPDFFADFVAGFFPLIIVGKKCPPEKSSRKIPVKILQNLHNKNLRHISAEGLGQGKILESGERSFSAESRNFCCCFLQFVAVSCTCHYSANMGLPLPLGCGVCETKSKKGRSRHRKPFSRRVTVLRGGLRPWSQTMVSEEAKPWGTLTTHTPLIKGVEVHALN